MECIPRFFANFVQSLKRQLQVADLHKIYTVSSEQVAPIAIVYTPLTSLLPWIVWNNVDFFQTFSILIGSQSYHWQRDQKRFFSPNTLNKSV